MTGAGFLWRGLYAIADTTLVTGASLERAVEGAVAGGARVIQYRDKSADGRRRRSEAGALVAICRRHGVPLIVNDDVELARELGADGVHLGREDTAYEEARTRLGAGFVIGVSCYDEIERAENAQALGADYVAFGAMFPSTTKPGAVPAGIGVIERARSRVRVPIVAIGGITPDNGGSLVEAGADMLAAVSGVFAQPDTREAASRYARLFEYRAEVEKR